MTSMSMAKYLLSLRIGQAAAMLAKDVSQEQIARECGFRTGKYFAQCFRRATGKSPAQYRAALSPKPPVSP